MVMRWFDDERSNLDIVAALEERGHRGPCH